MKLKLNLLENSYSFLNLSLEFYKKVDFDNHDDIFIEDNTSSYWKMSIVNMIQSLELLFKEALRREHEVLLHENIDKINYSNPKTVSISQAFTRVLNILKIEIHERDKQLINKLIAIRNEILHYEFQLTSQEAKTYLSRLYIFICRFHIDVFNQDISLNLHKNNVATSKSITNFYENLIIYNNDEISKYTLSEVINDIKLSQNLEYYKINSVNYKRIKYGDESMPLLLEYCPDCLVAKLQYHTPGCDIEECPKCHTQALTCNCYIKEIDEEEY